jgi:Outer membrane protein transport protein (OMPP1/FadL/TodX)
MKNIYIIIASIVTLTINAQQTKDIFRYSNENIKGTARFQAMSGAFGALGGDLSSISINPAGGAVFLNNHAAMTLNVENLKNNTNFFNTNSNSQNTNFNLSQIGGVGIFRDIRSNKWKSVSIGFNYDNTSDFDNELFVSGTNTNNSIAQYFLGYANGVPRNIIESNSFNSLNYREQQAFLGYESYIINPLSGSNTEYTSNVPTGSYNQKNSIVSSGFNGKLAFNVAGNYDDKLYLGVNLNLHFIDFTENQTFTESNTNPGAIDGSIRNMRFDNEIYTYGSGFSAQFGAIYRPIPNLRLGLSLNTPTWYEIFDETTQSISSSRVNESPASFVSDLAIYEPYSIRTPAKATGSFAYVFGKKGLISIDYAITDFSTMKTSGNAGDFSPLNREITNTFTTSGELRIGAEYKIKKLSLRGGFRNQTSPYKDKILMGDTNSISAGIGYIFDKFKLDFAYSRMDNVTQNPLFNVGLRDRVFNENIISNFSLTLSADLY